MMINVTLAVVLYTYTHTHTNHANHIQDHAKPQTVFFVYALGKQQNLKIWSGVPGLTGSFHC